MTVPVIRALVEQHPEVKVTVVSRPFFSHFFKDIPNVSFFAIDVKKRHKGFLGLLRLFNDLKDLKANYFADFHYVLRSRIISALFKLKGVSVASLDKGRNAKKALTREDNKVFAPVKTMFESHCDTLQRLGFKFDLTQPVFPSKPSLAKELYPYVDPTSKYKIGIAPFAQYDSKVYPLDLMQEVIDKLAEREDVQVFLFGGGEREVSLLNQLNRDNVNVVVMAGKVKLDIELNLIQQLDVMISMDSGNGHIAAMLGVNVVTLWGSTHPFAVFAPFNQPIEYSLTADRTAFPLLPTSVYGNKVVQGYEEVMRTIQPAVVCSKIEEIIKVRF